MIMATWLLVDCNYLCHRAAHTTGMLEHMGNPTGVAFGVIRDIQGFTDLLGATNTVLAWDHPDRDSLHRRQLLPTYKSTRNLNLTEKDKEERKSLYAQMEILRKDLFPRLGYRNIITIRGYEADDIIAEAANTLPEGDEGIIISSDGDLLQCLRPNISIFHPTRKQMITTTSFMAEWKIDPLQWVDVKCLAGCTTDDIPGIDGVGEKTAAGWFTGALKPGGKKYDAISKNLDLIQKNRPLVRLPYPGIQLPVFQKDETTESKRMEILVELGIRPSRGAKKPERRGGFF